MIEALLFSPGVPSSQYFLIFSGMPPALTIEASARIFDVSLDQRPIDTPRKLPPGRKTLQAILSKSPYLVAGVSPTVPK